LFAVASQSIADLRAELRDREGGFVAADQTDARWLVIDEHAPRCLAGAGEYRVTVSAEWTADAGAGDSAHYALQVWRLRR
jgi:hypothetical protein